MTESAFKPNADVDAFSGFIGAVCGSALFGSAAVALVLAFADGVGFGEIIMAVLFFIMALMTSIIFVPIVALFVGLPFSWMLATLRWENAITYTAGGAVLGLLPMLAGASSEWEIAIKGSFVVYGGVCGFLWWRLDRSARQPVIED